MNDYNFEDLRQQMEVLKQKLEHQEIINDRIVRQSMRKSANRINLRYYISIAMAVFVVPYSYWAFIKLLGISIEFWIATCVLMVICIIATLYNGKDLRDSDLMNQNLLDVRRKMARAKKFDNQWLFFGIPAILVWFAWLAYECYKKDGDGGLASIIVAGGIGLVLGMIIGLAIHLRTQRTYQEIIDQIEELESIR